jgi:hypothetical protein
VSEITATAEILYRSLLNGSNLWRYQQWLRKFQAEVLGFGVCCCEGKLEGGTREDSWYDLIVPGA